MAEKLTGKEPEGLAIVPCDDIYTDSSGKLAIIGIFNRLVVPKIPVMKLKICVYVSITEIYPGATCGIDIVHGETDEPVFKAEGPVDMDGVNPSTIFDMVFELKNVPFGEPGTYYVRLFGNKKLLLQRPFELLEKNSKKKVEDDENNNNGD